MKLRPELAVLNLFFLVVLIAPLAVAERNATGFQGIWYAIPKNPETMGENSAYKYSGGMATYPTQTLPVAVYRPEVNKTFFCYGGKDPKTGRLTMMISYYDHKRGLLARPVTVFLRNSSDAHENPAILVDPRGFIWLFASTHSEKRKGVIFKSRRPYAIDKWQKVYSAKFRYSQPWFVPGQGFMLLHTRIDGWKHRYLYWMNSSNGLRWSKPKALAQFSGHYQVSARKGKRVGTAFDYQNDGTNSRTNLYYLQTDDFGVSWNTVDGQQLITPLMQPENPALVHDYSKEGRLVYLKQLEFDASFQPVILYVLSSSAFPLPDSGPREWMTARWTGSTWELRSVGHSDHNYDHGAFYIEQNGTWRIIGPLLSGPYHNSAGGNMVMLESRNQGVTWKMVKRLTMTSNLNHNFARRPFNAKAGFYTFWADGNPSKRSSSRLYYANKNGRVFRLPYQMKRNLEAAKEVTLSPALALRALPNW